MCKEQVLHVSINTTITYLLLSCFEIKLLQVAQKCRPKFSVIWCDFFFKMVPRCGFGFLQIYNYFCIKYNIDYTTEEKIQEYTYIYILFVSLLKK